MFKCLLHIYCLPVLLMTKGSEVTIQSSLRSLNYVLQHLDTEGYILFEMICFELLTINYCETIICSHSNRWRKTSVASDIVCQKLSRIYLNSSLSSLCLYSARNGKILVQHMDSVKLRLLRTRRNICQNY
jgi:hypothetical protein